MEPSSYSGAGGKIRRRPFSRASASTTPYDRPPAAAAAQRLAAAAAAAYQGTPGGGWVSRLVDPASRLIAGGAARLFSTVFRKRLAPAPAPAALEAPASAAPPGRDAEPKQDVPGSTNIGLTPAGAMAKGKDPVGTSSGDKALSEVEHLLMRKTFTRVEFDRLTDLLRARTVEPDSAAQVDHHVDKSETRTRIDGTGGSTSHGMAVDHSPPANVPIRGVTSPTDLAKQYMSSRYLKEPQPSSSRSQLFPGNKAEAGNTGYYRTSGAPLVQELKELNNGNAGLRVNGYMASGLRGRSAICRMSRSPYFKGPSSYNDMNASPFSSSHARTPSLAADGRQVLKRRGADFENEPGSMGPIRRIRQKTNMMSHFKDAKASPRENFPPSRTIGSSFAEGSSPLQESRSSKRLLLETGQSLRTVEKQRHGEDGKSFSDNVPPVPRQPNKMAEKIFEQLNIIAPSPKDKQSGQRSIAGSPSKSTSKPVWQDNGPKGVSDPSSSRQFQDLDGDRPNDSDLNGSTLNKDKLKKDGSSKVLFNTFQDSGNKEIKSDHVATFNKPAISGNSVSGTTSRKPGFKMAVFEDLYEFDDDQETPIQSKNLIFETEVKTAEQKFNSKRKVQHDKVEQKVESTLSKKNAVSSSVSEQPRTSASKDVSTSGLFSSSDSEKKATPHVPANNNIGFTFPHVSPGDNTEATGSAVPLASNKDNKQASTSPFMFAAKPSSTSDLETSTTAGVKSEGRLGESVTKPTSLDNTNLERSNGRERAGDIHKSPDKVLPTAPPTSTPPLHFASAASTPSLSNGLSHASPPKLSNVIPTDKPAASSAPSTNIASFAVSSSSPPISSSIPAIPTFSYVSSTSAVKSESTSTETKPASSLFFSTVGASTEGKSVAPEPASKKSSNLNTTSTFSSNITTFSSSPLTSSSTFSSTATFSSSPVASSGAGIASTNSAPSTTLATAPGVQSASAPAFAFSSSGNSMFGFSSPAQSTGLSTTVGGSTSQASAASTIFGSKLPQPQGAMSQSSATQFSSSFPTVATGAAASSSLGSGTFSFGPKASSSGPGTVSFGVGASSSGPGSVSAGVGASSSAPGLFLFGASSGPGTVSFGAAPSSSAPGTVSFGVTTSSSGPAFGNSPFGSGAAFSAASSSAALSGSGSGFAFSAVSSSAASSLTAASTSMFSSSSTASSSAAFNNPFASTPSPPSMFTFGQPASSGGAFAFGAQSAPAFSSPSPPVYSFTSSSMNSSTPQAFGTANANTGFGMGSPANDQMNMEDSMADDTNQAAPAQASASAPVFGSSIFGQPGNSPAAPVFGQPGSSPAAPVFGAPAAQQPAGVFQFGGQQGSVPQQNPSFAPAGGSLEFQGGNFSLGSTGGGDKSGRRIIKPKRTQRKK